MGTTVFGIIGGGWRAEFYLRVAAALPGRFECAGMLVRDEAKGCAIERRFGVRTYRTLNELLSAATFDYVVVSVPRKVNPDLLRELAERGIPALSETPPAADLAGLIELHGQIAGLKGKVQVAEQYAFQPLHAARIAIARSGVLGAATQAQVSAAHGYHGICLIRKLLGIGYENAEIRAQRFVSPIVAGPNRNGPPAEEKLVPSSQDIAWLNFEGARLGVFDFSNDQYFSWIRSPRVLVRGDRGELNQMQLRFLKGFNDPVHLDLKRCNAGEDGNLEGLYLKGIMAGEDWAYQNPFVPARLTDDEIAVAECMARMAEYAAGGPEFYSLAEASQDHYLSLMIAQAIETGKPVTTERQPWARK